MKLAEALSMEKQVQYHCSEKSVALELNAAKKRILEVFRNYGIGTRSVKAFLSSNIAMYEIAFAPDGHFSKISSLENDIYHSLSALGIRTVPSIRGNATAVMNVIVPRSSGKIRTKQSD